MPNIPNVPPSPPDPAPPTSNRRQFLVGAAGLATLAIPGPTMARVAPKATSAGPDWEQLGRTLKGKLLRPDTNGYPEAIKIRNLRYAATRPAGVAMVADAKDVATAIAWARDNRVELVSKSGGHSYAGYCTTTGLVINLSGMTGVAINPATGIMTTTGAATNQGVEDSGKPLGRAIAGGQCPTVGIAGFVLGGGMGFSMRQQGLAIDSLLSTEIVTADGTLRCVSAEEPPDSLFWALRGGGGGNFGINTSFTFRTFVVPERVTIFSLKWSGVACVRAFLAFQEVLSHAPDSLGAIAHFGANLEASGKVQPYLRIFGQVVEAKQTADRLLAPVLAAAKPGESLIEEKDFWAAKDWLGEGPGKPNAFAERSRFHPKPLPEAGVGTLVDALAYAPIQKPDQVVSSSFFAWGGAVAKVSPDSTAFIHRKDFWLQAISCSWGSETHAKIDQLLTWQDGLYRTMGAYASDRAYQNFVDPKLEHPLTAYYGDHVHRLVEVKQKYDPSNVFTFAQSIPTHV